MVEATKLPLSRNLVLSPSRSNSGLVISRLVHLVANREIYNLGMVLDPVFAQAQTGSNLGLVRSYWGKVRQNFEILNLERVSVMEELEVEANV